MVIVGLIKYSSKLQKNVFVWSLMWYIFRIRALLVPQNELFIVSIKHLLENLENFKMKESNPTRPEWILPDQGRSGSGLEQVSTRSWQISPLGRRSKRFTLAMWLYWLVVVSNDLEISASIYPTRTTSHRNWSMLSINRSCSLQLGFKCRTKREKLRNLFSVKVLCKV